MQQNLDHSEGETDHATKAEWWTGVEVVEVVEGESSGLTIGWRTYAREYSPSHTNAPLPPQSQTLSWSHSCSE